MSRDIYMLSQRRVTYSSDSNTHLVLYYKFDESSDDKLDEV